MERLVETIIKKGLIPEHAPSWAKMNSVQWLEKLENIIQHPEKYRDSVLKQTLINAANEVK